MREWQTKTTQHGSCTITIHRPVLTSAEQAKREQDIKDTLGHTLREYTRRKETKK